MATIHKEISIAAPAEQVWAAVRDVGAVRGGTRDAGRGMRDAGRGTRDAGAGAGAGAGRDAPNT